MCQELHQASVQCDVLPMMMLAHSHCRLRQSRLGTTCPAPQSYIICTRSRCVGLCAPCHQLVQLLEPELVGDSQAEGLQYGAGGTGRPGIPVTPFEAHSSINTLSDHAVVL